MHRNIIGNLGKMLVLGFLTLSPVQVMSASDKLILECDDNLLLSGKYGVKKITKNDYSEPKYFEFQRGRGICLIMDVTKHTNGTGHSKNGRSCTHLFDTVINRDDVIVGVWRHPSLTHEIHTITIDLLHLKYNRTHTIVKNQFARFGTCKVVDELPVLGGKETAWMIMTWVDGRKFANKVSEVRTVAFSECRRLLGKAVKMLEVSFPGMIEKTECAMSIDNPIE